MAEKKKKTRPPRQDWKPNFLVQLIYRIWMIAFGVFKIALGAAATVIVIVGACVVVFVGILGDYLEQDILPNSGYDLGAATADRAQNSVVYYLDSDGDIQILQQIHAEDNSSWADLEDIPEDLIHATIAIEDKRFYEHQGVDWITTVKACAGIFFGDGDKGGSTITQQLIKNATGDNQVTVQRKVMEIFRATQLEKNYDKDTILEYYLNEIYLGNRCYGVRAAAEKYFGKEVEMLTTAECAAIISITNNPSLFNPYRDRLDAEGKTGAEQNRGRQVDTLFEMRNQGWITEEEYQQALAQEMVFKDGIAPEDRMNYCEAEGCGYKGIASTFVSEDGTTKCPRCGTAMEVTKDESTTVYSWYVDVLLEDVAMDLAAQDGVTEWNTEIRKHYIQQIQRGGYHIYACIDMEVQEQVDKIYENLDEIPAVRSGQQLQSGVVIVDNSTGDIVALSGGVGEKQYHDEFNRVTDAKRQSGSSIKPLSVYGPAFELEMVNPASVVADMPNNYDDDEAWPKNDTRSYSYRRTIYSAIVNSVNGAAVSTLELIGAQYAFDFAKDKFNLSTLTDHYEASNGEIWNDIGLSQLALGAQTLGVTVRDMASAFATFANDGVYREGRTYTKVYDSNGQVVLDNTQDSQELLTEKSVNYINYCLNGAVLYGTGTVADFKGQNIYGKTGSTANNRDRWFCGFTGHYTAAVWCGFDTPAEIVLKGNTTNPAARLWKKVMQPIHDGLKRVRLHDTSKLKAVEICLDSGLLATDACRADVREDGTLPRVEEVLTYREDMPEESCTLHVMVEYCTEGQGVCNEYCHLFAEATADPEADPEDAMIIEKALCKMTLLQLEEIEKAAKYDTRLKVLGTNFLRNDYIYLVDEKGKDAEFHGIDGKANKGIEAPYIVCTLHTQQAWEEYQASLQPSEPTEPENPLFPDFSDWLS